MHEKQPCSEQQNHLQGEQNTVQKNSEIETPQGQRYLADSLHNNTEHHTLLASNVPSLNTNAPSWLRPFFSLRIQLTLAYTILLLFVVALTYLLLSQETAQWLVLLIIFLIIVIGSTLAFTITTLLLRPLFRVTDAAQAIAIGDLAQRDRLPLRLPPQDEVDRLAGSLNEMVLRLEQAEATTEASQARFRQFFSDASHQLRTPLTSIRGFTDLLLRSERKDPEMTQHMLTRMKNEAERMTRLINDLLTLARLDDTHPLKVQYIDLIELAIEGIQQTRARSHDEREITLQVETEERLGLQADRERIKQLIFVLLDNALKYGRSSPDGYIRLKLNKQDNKISMSVSDNGNGIAEEDQAHIFESFYRGRHKATEKTVISGTGLGLSIASAIVLAHDGTISVQSEPGNTEFTVLLPCVG